MSNLEPPIFILRYRNNARIIHSMSFIVAAFLGYELAFGIPHGSPPMNNIVEEIYLRSVGVWMLLCAILSIIDITFFKEVRLYRDRLIKEWWILGSKAIILRDAKLKGHNYLVRMRKLCNVKKKMLWFVSSYTEDFIGISYCENMATTEDAQKMSRFMAQVTGRDRQEFEKNSFKMNPLIKEDSK